ncbi:hyphally regulated cell wall protein 3-like isoform X2 [Hibiscus syriacus]|uniref:Hyphally regulated cell wall protein 3-like isoform X2 n=1 Tax=Hibiscus syriacus TaxID=106335 RepID=A0A6A3B7W5_HIBSY|nr:hyphally regulated cell wall protein 3-like isoform X2 [Hibiscus syriacus]
MSGGGFRVSSIPNSVRKTIQNIKEITGNHSEDEIYAMLKECSMDPNETTQRLLLQDPFQEVKRKRDRKKESLNNKESAESRWRPGSQGRGTRGGQGNFPPRYAAHETGVSKSSGPGRDNGMNRAAEKGSGQSLSTLQETKPKESTLIASPVSAMAHGPTGVVVETFSAPARKAANPPQENSSVGNSESSSAPSSVDAINKPSIAFGSGDMSGQPAASYNDCSMSSAPASSSAIFFSSSKPELVPSSVPRLLGTSDTIKGESNQASTEPNAVIPTENKLAVEPFPSSEPALVPSNVSCLLGSLDTVKHEIGNNLASTERNAVIPTESKLASAATELSSSFLQGKMPSKFPAVVKHPLGESSHPSSTATHGSSATRPSSNYNGRSQQITGPHKVGSNKEWKPKPVTSNVVPGARTAGASEVPIVSLETDAQSLPVSNVLNSEVDTSKLQKKLEELHLPQRQHVIIPNHIHVPESERTKLSFGSFDASFGVALNYVGGQESDKCSTPLSEASQDVDETAEEHGSSNQNALETAEEGDCTDRPQSPAHAPGNLSGAVTSPNYSFGIVPPMLAPFGNAESQAREVSRLSSFVVPQPFDPAAYYAQFYRSSSDTDGRVSPFASGVATKYNGNVAVFPPQTSQSQEGGNSLVLTTTSSPIVTQAAGMMQSSIALTQQPVPVYRSAAGVHLPHYPPNYIQYAPFYSPFYVPSPAIHQFINNGVFPQQTQAGTVYPSAPAGPTTGVKFSLPQFKPGSNTLNSAHIGMPSGYGPYGSSPAGYNPSSAATTGNSTTNEDLGGAQFKENNVYASGQQSEGSAVWIAPPGRDISNLPASSFYNLAPPGQNVTFAPTQVVPGSFAGIYHPQAATAAAVQPLLQQAQTMAGAVNMGGSAAGVYRQPQHAQMNWSSLNGREHQEDTSLARIESVNPFEEAEKEKLVNSIICFARVESINDPVRL